MTAAATASVIVPAHDEAAHIAENLARLVGGAGGDAAQEWEVIVVANGCTDATARLAREVSPRIRVIEIAAASKIAALNAGDAAATAFPRIYLDADVRITPDAVGALVELLGDDAPRAAAPRLQVDTGRSSWPARQYFRGWELSSYHREGHVGSGVYALSRAGRERFGAFPDVIADDRFVQLQFAADERVQLADHTFTVPAPRTLRAQIRRNARILAGNRQLAELGVPAAESAGGGHRALLARAARRPSLWPAVAVYAYGYLAARRRADRLVAAAEPIDWHRDETTRV